jgi:TetR/AcrR family transcriptional regulator, lmrAB and yxaGH operons repressor
MAQETREQMVDAAAQLFQREGYHATSWRRLVDESGAPWGSISHHFPGGKEELGVAAIERGGAAVTALIEHCFAQRRSAARAVGDWFAFSARMLEDTGYAAGCPVATVALETAATSPALAGASRDAFAAWERALRAGLTAHGLPRARAAALAGTVLTLMEGALIRARVERSTEPVTAAGRLASGLVADAAPA